MAEAESTTQLDILGIWPVGGTQTHWIRGSQEAEREEGEERAHLEGEEGAAEGAPSCSLMCACLVEDLKPEDALECEGTFEGCFDTWASYTAYREETLEVEGPNSGGQVRSPYALQHIWVKRETSGTHGCIRSLWMY